MANTGFVTTGMSSTGPAFFVNGHPFRFVGFNYYDLVLQAPNLRSYSQQYTELATMASYGATVTRCWARGETASTTPDTFAFQYGTTGGVWQESTFVVLDNLIAAANQANMRLILSPLGSGTDFGCLAAYTQWYNTIYSANATNQNLVDTPNYFNIYATYLSKLLNRTNTVTGILYKQDPTIMAWECCSELNYTLTTDVHPNTLSSSRLLAMTGFYNSASTVIKTFDPNHLVGTGCINNWADVVSGDSLHAGTAQGLDFGIQHAIPTIDYCDIHMYPAVGFVTQGSDCVCRFSSTFVYEKHYFEYASAAKQMGKPVIVGEYSIDKRNTVTGPQVNFYPRDASAAQFFSDLFGQGFSGILYWDYNANRIDNTYGVQAGVTYTDPNIPVGNQTDTKLLSTIKNVNASLVFQDNPPIGTPCS